MKKNVLTLGFLMLLLLVLSQAVYAASDVLRVEVSNRNTGTVPAPVDLDGTLMFPLGRILYIADPTETEIIKPDPPNTYSYVTFRGKCYKITQGKQEVTEYVTDEFGTTCSKTTGKTYQLEKPASYPVKNEGIFVPLSFIVNNVIGTENDTIYSKETNTLVFNMFTWDTKDTVDKFTLELDGKVIGTFPDPIVDFETNLYPVEKILNLIDSRSRETVDDFNGFGLPYSKITFKNNCYQFIKYRGFVTKYDNSSTCSGQNGQDISFNWKAKYIDHESLKGVYAPSEIIGKIIDAGAVVTENKNGLSILTAKYVEQANLLKKSIILKINDPWMYVNDKVKKFDSEQNSTPVIREGRTLLPIANVITEFGGSVRWNGDEQKVSVTLRDHSVDLWIGKTTATVNGVTKTLDVAPAIIDGRTMVPLRFVSDNLGLQLVWDGDNQVIALYQGEFNSIPKSYSSYFRYKDTK